MCHTTCGSTHITTSHQPPPPPDPQTPPPQPPQLKTLTPHPSTINPNPLAPNPLNTKHSTPPPLNPSSHRSPRTQLPPLTIKHALPMQPCNTHTRMYKHAHRNLYIPPPSTPRTHQIKYSQAGVGLQRFIHSFIHWSLFWLRYSVVHVRVWERRNEKRACQVPGCHEWL